MATKPPQNLAAEQAVIGSVLMSEGACIPQVLEYMRTDDFYTPRHQTILEAALMLHSMGEPVDATTVAMKLQTDGNIMRVGEGTYLLECMQSTPTSINVSYYAKTVASMARLRRLEQLCQRGIHLINEGGGEAEEVIDQFQRFLDDSNLSEMQKIQGFGDLYDEWVTWMHTDIPALPTPWADVNEKLAGGLHRQRLYIVGARPGCGKSVLILNVIAQIAKAGYKGIVFSLEMPKMEVLSRMLAAGARVPYGELVKRRMTANTVTEITHFMSMNPNFQTNVMVDDQVDHTIESIMTAARYQKRHGLDFIAIDYIQLLNSSGRAESRYQELGVMSRLAKQMSRKLDIAVLIAAQLNRNPEQQNRLPNMADLRESGNLEADADVVLMLSKGGDETQPELPLITMSIVKNRTGVAPDMVNLPQHFEQARIGV